MIIITPNYNFGIYSTVIEESKGLRCDGSFLPFSVIGTTYTVSSDDSIPVASNPSASVLDIADLIKRIDADVDKIYADAVGNRVSEYSLGEQESLAYKNAGYTGAVPSTVQSWATAKGQTTQWAADDMIATASAWRNAQAAMRAQRLAKKESARQSSSLSALMTVATDWDNFVSYIRGQLGIG